MLTSIRNVKFIKCMFLKCLSLLSVIILSSVSKKVAEKLLIPKEKLAHLYANPYSHHRAL